jgi:acetyltransferase-like isoleucine patch superfamily enzyme
MSSNSNAPTAVCWRLPRWLDLPFRAIYHAHQAVAGTLRWLYRFFYAGPLFRGRCDVVGADFDLMKIPDAGGHSHLAVGTDVRFRGHVGVGSGRIFDNPELLIGNRVNVGHGLVVTVNQKVEVGDDVRFGEDCRLMDTDSHPREAILRAANAPPSREEIKPVRVCANAAVGSGSTILKGVTVGEGATVGVNSVVVANVPAYAIVAGNPARLMGRNAQPPAKVG